MLNTEVNITATYALVNLMPHLPPYTGDRWGLDQSHDLIPLPLGMSNPLVAPVQDGGYVGIRPLSPIDREAISSQIPTYPR